MANTLTNLTPDLFAALDVVSRELVGFIPAVAMDASLERAAKDQVIRSFVAPASTAADITPGQLAPNTGDQTFTNKQITISKSRSVPIRWNGEETRAMDTGPGQNKMFQDQVAQGIRTLVNEIETDLAALYIEASNAAAPDGSNLFAAGLQDAANIRKCLVDNGAPGSDMQLVLGTQEGADIRGLSQMSNVNNAGNEILLRQGVLLDIFGMAIRESGQRAAHSKGAMASATTNTDGYAVGDTAITLATAGTGVVAAGDVITFAGDTNKYVVASVAFAGANPAAGDIITLAAPGLKIALAASAVAITVVDNAQPNMAFHRNAIQLVTRVPAEPKGGDSADDVMVFQDPRSGLAFEMRAYREYRQVHYELGIAWGVAVIKPEHLCLLID